MMYTAVDQGGYSDNYAGYGASSTRDKPAARIDEQVAWTFGHLTKARLAALCWAFTTITWETVDPKPFVSLANRGGTPYLKPYECELLAGELAQVYRDRQFAAEARERLQCMLKITDDDVRRIAKALRTMCLDSMAEGAGPQLAPIVLVHTTSPSVESVTHEVALQLAVLLGITEDLDADGWIAPLS